MYRYKAKSTMQDLEKVSSSDTQEILLGYNTMYFIESQHGVISQKTGIFIATAMRTPNPRRNSLPSMDAKLIVLVEWVALLYH
jgi:hypothetical protein